MDTGAGKSCVNYTTFEKVQGTLKQMGYHCRVVGADGSDLGAMGTVECEITLGNKVVTQTFVVCRNLQSHIRSGFLPEILCRGNMDPRRNTGTHHRWQHRDRSQGG